MAFYAQITHYFIDNFPKIENWPASDPITQTRITAKEGGPVHLKSTSHDFAHSWGIVLHMVMLINKRKSQSGIELPTWPFFGGSENQPKQGDFCTIFSSV